MATEDVKIETVETESKNENQKQFTEAETQAYIEKLRKENESYRKKFEAKLAEEKEAKQKELEQKQEFKTLYEQTKAEADEFRIKYAQLNEMQTKRDESERSELLESITDAEAKEFANDLPLDKLRLFAKVQQKKTVQTMNTTTNVLQNGTKQSPKTFAEWKKNYQ